MFLFFSVLIGRNEILKISDFGTSRTWGEQSTCMSFAGTVAWMAPEVIRNEPCNEKVDIWSFGVLLWELLTCEIPYQNVDSSAIIWGVGSNKLYLPIPTTCPEGYKLLIKQCWANKPRNRPSFKNILMHLDIASVEILSYQPEDYFRTQVSLIRNYVSTCVVMLLLIKCFFGMISNLGKKKSGSTMRKSRVKTQPCLWRIMI